MASQATTHPKTPNVQSATQESRSEAIWKQTALLNGLEKEMEHDLKNFIDAIDGAKASLATLQQTFKDSLERHPKAAAAQLAREQIAALKAQLIEGHKPADESTITNPDGTKVQFRSKTDIDIVDGKAFATALVSQGLWDALGTTIAVETKTCLPLVKKGALPGAKAVESYTVALLARKE